MKKLLFTYNDKEYYANGHTNYRMRVRRIECSDIEAVITKPTRMEERGYETLFEGISNTRLLRVYCREKPGYIEILTTHWRDNGYENNKG